MYDMFFREWWNEYYGASESRQHRDVFKHCNALHLGQKIHPATRLCAKDVIWLFCGHAGGQYLTPSRILWRIWFTIFIWLFAVTVSCGFWLLCKTTSQLSFDLNGRFPLSKVSLVVYINFLHTKYFWSFSYLLWLCLSVLFGIHIWYH